MSRPSFLEGAGVALVSSIVGGGVMTGTAVAAQFANRFEQHADLAAGPQARHESVAGGGGIHREIEVEALFGTEVIAAQGKC